MQNFCCRIFTSNFISQTPLCNMKVLPSRVTSCKLRGRFFLFFFFRAICNSRLIFPLKETGN